MNRLFHCLRLPLFATVALAWPLLTVGADNTSGSLPWNAPLELLKDNLTGPTATAIILIALAFGLAVWSFADDNRGLHRAFKALMAMAIVAGVTGVAGGLFSSLGIQGAVL